MKTFCCVQAIHYNGAGIAGTRVKLVTNPIGISNVISMEVLPQIAFFVAVGLNGGLYVCNLQNLEVYLLLKNNSESCEEIKRLCECEEGIVFTDSGDRKVKFFCPSEKNVKTCMDGRKEQ